MCGGGGGESLGRSKVALNTGQPRQAPSFPFLPLPTPPHAVCLPKSVAKYLLNERICLGENLVENGTLINRNTCFAASCPFPPPHTLHLPLKPGRLKELHFGAYPTVLSKYLAPHFHQTMKLLGYT